MTKSQVRLDEDVADALQRSAERQDRSLSAEANAWLRRSLHLQPEARASVTNPRSVGCPHPANRRIGGRCALCGKQLGR